MTKALHWHFHLNGFQWWRHQIETLSTLLAICVGNSLITSEFPTQRPVMRRFDAFFDLHLNKGLSKQWGGWWFEMPSRPLWCHCNAMCIITFPLKHSTGTLPWKIPSVLWVQFLLRNPSAPAKYKYLSIVWTKCCFHNSDTRPPCVYLKLVYFCKDFKTVDLTHWVTVMPYGIV